MRQLGIALVVAACVASPAARAADKLGEDLVKAAKKGDLARLKALLQQGAPVDARDKDQKTPLWEAARHDRADVVALLLQAKADPNLPSKDGDTPLLQAVAKGNPRVVELLIAAKADTNAANKNGDAPLLLAAGRDDPAMLAALLSAGADPRLRNRHGVTLLMAVAGGGHTELVPGLLQQGAKPGDEDDDGETALHHAARQGRGATARALIDAGADVDHASHGGVTPLMLAAGGGHQGAVSALLQSGAHPNLRNSHNKDWTAILYAVQGGTSAVIDELAGRGAQLDVEDTSGDQPIHLAARGGRTAIVEALLARGASANQRGGLDRKTPLEIAVDRDDRGTAQALLEHHACVTPASLEQAAKKKCEKMIKLLDGYSHAACGSRGDSRGGGAQPARLQGSGKTALDDWDGPTAAVVRPGG